MYNKLKKVTFIALFFILLLLASEALFLINHKGAYFLASSYFLARAKYSFAVSDLEGTFGYLSKGAKFVIDKNSLSYKDVFPDSYSTQTLFNFTSDELRNASENYIKNVDFVKFLNKADLSHIYYSLSLPAYRNSEEESFFKFLQTAYYINPELSHLNVELANYYLSTGEKDMAKKQVETCLKFEKSYSHCKDYEQRFLKNNEVQEVGFQDAELEKYYNSK